jgi:hypothetical protein
MRICTVVVIGTALLLGGNRSFAQERDQAEKIWSRVNLSPAPVQAPASAPSIRVSSAITSPSLPLQDSPDIEITAPLTNTTQSENSVFIHPLNNNIVFVSNNSSNYPVSTIYGADYWTSTDGGLTWTGSVQGAGGTNQGDPAAAIARTGRFHLGYIANSGNGAAYSTNNGQTWTHVQVYPNPGSLADKNHLWVDNSPTSPYVNNVYASWTDFGGANNNRIVFKRSTDGGLTWPGSGINLSSAVGGTSHDQGVNIATGPNGEVYVTWAIYDGTFPVRETAIGFAKSTDGGATFAPATRIITNILGIRSQATGGGLLGGKDMRTASFPSMAVNMQNGNIYIVWTNIGVPGVNSGTERDVWMAKSTNGGTTWGTPIRVNQDAPNNGKDQWFPWISCDPNTGILAVVFYDSRDFAANDQAHTYVAVSYNDGATWEDFRVSDASWSGDGSGTGFSANYAGDYIGVGILNGKVYPLWTDRRSTGNRLSTWISPVQLAVNVGWAKGVVQSGGNPVSGVEVDFIEPQIQISGTSDVTGNYRVAATVDTSAGSSTYTIRARKFGYLTFTDTITLVLNDTVTRNINITPAPGGTLAVHAFNSDTTGLPANVKVYFGEQVVLDQSTDSLSGRLYAPLPVGSYNIVVNPPSPYATRQFDSVQIAASETTLVNALVRWVIEHNPLAMRDTLPPDGTNSKTLTLTNTTGESVSFQLLTEETSLRYSDPYIPPMFAEESPSKDQYLELKKDEKDPRFGPRQMAGGGGPDQFGYIWIDSDEPGGPTFSWIDISGTGTALDSTSAWVPTGTNRPGDEGYYQITLPFAFPYYGNTYTTAYIGTNGVLLFQPPTADFFTNAAIPTPGGSIDNFIAGFWDDLEVRAAGRVYYGMSGENFVVQFQDMPRFASAVSNYTFQFVLKPNGHILTQYLNMGFGGGTLISATVGIENQNGTVGLQSIFNAAYIHNNLAVLFKVLGVDWLEYTPNAGVIPANSQQVISADFDASGIDPGSLLTGITELRVVHPDVDVPLAIPASLQVELVDSAFIIVRPGALEFPLTPINMTSRDSARIQNGGGTTLQISSMTSNNGSFVVAPTSGTIAPGDSLWIHVDYTPTTAGTDTGRITITNNSVNASVRYISLTGTSIGVPHFAARIDSLVQIIEGGVRDSIQFYVRNDGTGPGTYNAQAVMFSPSGSAAAKPTVIPMTVQPAARSVRPQPRPSDTVSDGRDFGPSVSGSVGSIESLVDPQYYNFNTGGSGNTFPFNVSAGKRIQWLFLPGNFSQPTPAPEGRITTLYFRISTTGSGTFTDMVIKMGQASLTELPAGDWYSGPMQTVYVRASVDLSASTVGEWLSIPLDVPFAYNPAQSLIVDINQCARVGSGLSTYHTTISGVRRNASLVGGSCPLPFANTSALVVHLGLDIIQGTWLSVNPTEGSLAVADSVLMTARFDATDPEVFNNPGNYFGEVLVRPTNSALAETLSIPVRMFVVPPDSARLTVSPDSLEFGDLEIDSSRTLSVLVRNIGGANLNVTNIAMTDTNFSASPTNFIVAPLDTQRIHVTFTAPAPGATYEGTMQFVSNDPQAPNVALRGRSVGIAHIVVNPDSFFFAISPGDSGNGALTIRNTGLGELSYTSQVFGGFIGEETTDIGNSSLNLATTSGLMRGGVVQVTTSVQLQEIRSWLIITSTRELRYVVYENTTGTSFSKIFETVVASSGTGGPQWYSSGQISVTLEAGKRYAIGVDWPAIAGMTYYWQASAPVPVPISFGTITGGLAQTAYPPPATITQGALASLYYTQLVTSSDQWLNITAGGAGTVASGDSAVMNFRVYTSQLPLGRSSASLRVLSNDPLAPTISIPVDVDVLTGVEDAMGIPTVYHLDQNYPNPFNPSTVIQYGLPSEATVTLRVFNVIGQEVATLVNEQQKAGYYSVTWDGRNKLGSQVASGVYFFRIDAAPVSGTAHFTQVKKMMMVK